MTSQDDLRRRELERQLAVEDAARASQRPRGFFSRGGLQESASTGSRPIPTQITPETVRTERVQDGGILDRVGNFFGGIADDVAQRRTAFYAPVVLEPEVKPAPVTLLGKIGAGFARAAYATTHNRVVDFVFRNRVARIIGWPFAVIPHYIRYPLGLPGDRQNFYTRVTINADFYTRATAAAIFGPLVRRLGKGFGEAGDFIFDFSEQRLQALKQSNKRSLYYAIKASRGAWRWGGRWTAGAAYRYLCCDKTQDGERHFSPLQVANSAIFGTFMWKVGFSAVTFAVVAPIYYYGSWTTIHDLYVPASGVFLNQSFEKAAQAGQIFSPRDEVWTVQAKIFNKEKSEVEEIRFDLDSNLFFFFYMDAWRPDLAADKMHSQSPYGVRCDAEATGMYAKLPRGIRFVARWMNVRPEIVRVLECEQLREVPDFLKLKKEGSLLPPKSYSFSLKDVGHKMLGDARDANLQPHQMTPTKQNTRFLGVVQNHG